MVEWYPDRVIPLTESYCREFKRELDRAIRAGDLKERTSEDYEAFLKAQQAAQKKREREAKKAAEAAAKAAEEKQDSSGAGHSEE